MDPLKPQPAFSDLEIGIMAHVFQKYCANAPHIPCLEFTTLLPKCYTRGMNKLDLDSRYERARKKICNFDTLQLAYRKSEDSIESQILEDGCAMVEISQYVASENCIGVELKTKTKTKTKTTTNTTTKTTTNTTSKGVKRSRAE